MSITPHKRIDNIDLLKGLVMVIMALDHVRDYFHYDAFLFNPADPIKSNLFLFFTRWITHFCAPTFCFLAGTSAYFVGRRKTKKELTIFLLTRGLWLLFVDVVIVGFGWFFDFGFHTISMLTIWSLGWSMIFLSLMVHFSLRAILITSCVLIFGHNLFDGVQLPNNFLWSFLHVQQFFPLSEGRQILVGYPIVPWIAVMSLGYYFGQYYNKEVVAGQRRKVFNIIGLASMFLFVMLTYSSLYGDPTPFNDLGSLKSNIIDFFNPAKYPPSLQYLLMTLGMAFLFLANSESWKGKMVNFFSMFGRVPFFYYILHIYLIHVLAIVYAHLSGFDWRLLILHNWIGFETKLIGYGYNLLIVYIIWIAVILTLYPFCEMFDRYKQNNKHKWWLSYL